MNPFFDLHIHPSFKPFLTSDREDERSHCWNEFNNLVGVVRSQGSLNQMKDGGVHVAVAGLYALERPTGSNLLLEHVAPLLSFMSGRFWHFPVYANYFDMIREELRHLRKSANYDPEKGLCFKILNKISEREEGKMNLILGIEGGHCLENFNTNVLDNLRMLKEGPDRFLYMTLVHMTQHPFSNHSFGMKLVRENNQFKPAGFGLTDLGKSVIDLAYDDSVGHRIHIDIKHMSLVARRQFYRYRKEQGYDRIPIMATHMGVTGISNDPLSIAKYFSGRPVRNGDFVEVRYNRPSGIGRGVLNATSFNPWSINLYNEEIPEILDSDGLIGINMDQRIMGAQEVKGEYYCAKELSYILSGYRDPQEDLLAGRTEPGEFTEEPEKAAEDEETRAFNERKHLRHVCNNILHFVKVGGDRAWNQLCIGSDFDGLIDPVNNCTSAREFPKLEEGLLDMLPRMMKEGEMPPLKEPEMEKKVRGIMYDNAIHFLEKHFD